MLSCKDIGQLASESYDRSLTLGERFSIRLHILRCRMCELYVGQLKFLRRACADAGEEQLGTETSLAEDARERIRSRLDQNR